MPDNHKTAASPRSGSVVCAADLGKLLAITANLGDSAGLDEFLEKFSVQAAGFCGFYRSFIGLVDGNGCEIVHAVDGGSSRPMRIQFDSPMARKVISEQKPYSAEGLAPGFSGALEAMQMFDVRQYLLVPIIYQSNVIGLLGLLDRTDESPITRDVTQKAESLCAQVAVSMVSVLNLQRSEEHRRRSEALIGMALELGTSLNVPDLVRSFTARMKDLLGARAAALCLARGPVMEVVVLEDARASFNRSEMRDLGEFFTRLHQAVPDPFYSQEAATLLDGMLHTEFHWQEVCIVRLAGASGDVLGMLCLADCSRVISGHDWQMVKALAGHASVVLENSRLFSQIAQSNKKWTEIFDSLSDFIVVHDDDHMVLRVNVPLAQYLNARPADLIGSPMSNLMPDRRKQWLPTCPFCLAETEKGEFFHSVQERTFLVTNSRIHGTLDEGLQTIHVLRDVTENRDAERRYRELFDNVQEGIFFCDPKGKFVDVNNAMVRLLGYSSKEELMQQDVPSRIYATREQYHAARKSAETGMQGTLEVALRRKNGSYVTALESSLAVRDSRGEIVQFRGLVLDITDTKLYQSQLQRERDFNTQILNNTQSMILVADTAGLISYANRRCYDAGQYDSNALMGHRFAEFVSSDDQPKWHAEFDATLLGTLVNNLELNMVRGDGAVGRFSVNLSPMCDDHGNVNSIVVVMTDITDVSMIQSKMMHTEKLAAVGQLVSGVAHEVNNPLTAIMGFADLMLENPALPGAVRQDLHVIMQEAQRTKEIVQNLLSFARQTPPQRRPVDVNAIARRTMALRSYDFASHGVRVVERFQENLPEVVGDSQQLQQVFLNILNNAYDAVSEIDRRGRIEIETAYVDDGFVRITFRDNGPGVTHPERIFDPFFTTKDVGKGTGLGLSICYGIVREHGGEIMVWPQKPNVPGATFCVRLPVVMANVGVGTLNDESQGEVLQ